MQKRLYIIIFLSILFILNLLVYYTSSDYRFFLKKLKYGSDELIYTDSRPLSDEYVIRNNVPIETMSSSGSSKDTSVDYKLDDTDKEFISYFSGSVVEKAVVENSLFAITEEYPDKYTFYKGENIDMYFFGIKSFDSMYDFFDVLSYDNPISLKKFKLNEKKSFFINLDKSDSNVRFVLEYKNHCYGFKIKKSQYNLVKDTILNKMN
ncbi:MAG: hypothetical protein PHG82_01355 [Candidatus Gracilibacteria bacterium]|nr:hypothetical protein [Candidatus Gracilibacteria bacterium]